MPYHVRITKKSNKSHDELELDLTRKELLKSIVTPFNEGRRFTCGGAIIEPDDIERIRVTYTEEKSEDLIPEIQEERRSWSWATPTISDEWYVADGGKDVTRRFIKELPQRKERESSVKHRLNGTNITITKMINSNLQHSSPGANQQAGDIKKYEKDDKWKGYAAGVICLIISALFFYVAFPFDRSDGIIIIFGLTFAVLGIASIIKPLSVGQVADVILQNITRSNK